MSLATISRKKLKDRIKSLEPNRRDALRDELRWAVRSAHKPEPMSRVEFAARRIVIPEGKHEGSLWRKEFQPFAGHLLHLMDTLGFRRFAITGCVQSGKTLVALVFNVCWHLFELKQSVIFVVPELSMAEKKWKDEIEPVINASRWLRKAAYGDSRRTSVPKGKGSKSGFSNVIRFANGTRLEFMGSTGSDSRRSSSTAQVVFKTEVDRYDTASATSREASAAQTVEDRAESYGDDAYIYEECTLTTTTGRIHRQVRIGTDHAVHFECPQCHEYIRPTRSDFVGFEDCSSPVEARENGTFICSKCAYPIDEETRRAMNNRGVPVSRGQTVKAGSDGSALIEGDLPPTEIFSFWWNAFDNLFWSTERLAAKEWTALYSDDAGDEDKQAKQKRWTEPAVATVLDLSRLTMATMISRTVDRQRTMVPLGTKWMSAGCDVRGTQLHYVVRAWTYENERLEGTAIDIGWMNIDRDILGAHDAVIDALRRFRDDRAMTGLYRDSEGKSYVPGWTLIDAGWKERWIWEFALECATMGLPTWIPILGRGQSDPQKPGTYRQPERIDNDGGNKKIYWIGDECHLRKSSKYANVFTEAGCQMPPLYMLCNTDEGKSFVRDGYNSPAGTNGSLTTFKAGPADERDVVADHRRQLLAERETQIYIEGRGVKKKFINESKTANHYGDCDNYCCYAAQLCGAPISLGKITSAIPMAPKEEPLTMPDGRPYMAVGHN